MPSSVVKSLADKSGKSVDTVERYWGEAKKTSMEDFGKENYAYITGIVKKRLGLSEETVNIDRFLNSNIKAKDFINESYSKDEDAQVSGSLGNIAIGPTGIVKSKDLEMISEADPSLQAPKRWWDSMISKIEKQDVDDPEAVVGRIWTDLSDAKKAEIRGREGKTFGPAKEAVDGEVNPVVPDDIRTSSDDMIENAGGGDGQSVIGQKSIDAKKSYIDTNDQQEDLTQV